MSSIGCGCAGIRTWSVSQGSVLNRAAVDPENHQSGRLKDACALKHVSLEVYEELRM